MENKKIDKSIYSAEIQAFRQKFPVLPKADKLLGKKNELNDPAAKEFLELLIFSPNNYKLLQKIYAGSASEENLIKSLEESDQVFDAIQGFSRGWQQLIEYLGKNNSISLYKLVNLQGHPDLCPEMEKLIDAICLDTAAYDTLTELQREFWLINSDSLSRQDLQTALNVQNKSNEHTYQTLLTFCQKLNKVFPCLDQRDQEINSILLKKPSAAWSENRYTLEVQVKRPDVLVSILFNENSREFFGNDPEKKITLVLNPTEYNTLFKNYGFGIHEGLKAFIPNLPNYAAATIQDVKVNAHYFYKTSTGQTEEITVSAAQEDVFTKQGFRFELRNETQLIFKKVQKALTKTVK